eukprot:5433998-Prymnesium_polylepis.1
MASGLPDALGPSPAAHIPRDHHVLSEVRPKYGSRATRAPNMAVEPRARLGPNFAGERHAISEPITLVPHAEKVSEVTRGAYWRKQPAAGQALCAGQPPGSLRPTGFLDYP